MGSAPSSPNVVKVVGLWMWKVGDTPWEDSNEWRQYSDIENRIIEEAFEQKKSTLELDGYYIDLRKHIQTSKQDSSKQRPIKRISRTDNMQRSRTTKRYILEKPELTAESVALGWTSAWSRFLLAAGLFGDIADDQLVDRVEKSAEGILEEGNKIGKRIEAEWIAKELRNVKDKPKQDIGVCCVKIFTMDSFFYTLVNKVLRESEVQSAGVQCAHDFTTEEGKIHGRTLGPFCSLLWLYLYESPSQGLSYVYRSASLSQQTIADYAKHKGEWMVWNDFSSATKKKSNAYKDEGNTIYQIKIRCDGVRGVVDVSSLSDYPAEGEVLLIAGIPFEIRAVDYIQSIQKHIISIEM